MIKVGKATAGLLLLAVGGALLADRLMDTNLLGYAADWWPLVFILLGLEYIWVNFKYGGRERTRLEIGGVAAAVLVCAAIVAYSQGRLAPAKWLDGFDWQFGSVLSGEFGHKFEKEPITVRVTGKTDKLVVDNPNGGVVLKAGDGDRITIETTVWVDKLDEDKSRQVADASKVEVAEGETLRVSALGETYSGRRKPRMNMVVTVPAAVPLDIELQLRNGRVEADNVPIRDELVVRTTNGSVSVNGLDGNLIADTTNGSIRASGIGGMADLGTTNGAVTVADVSGDAFARTTNASVRMERIRGKAEAETQNGAIGIEEAERGVRAKTTNGAVTVASHTVGGDWKAETTNGRIELKLPSQGHYTVEGEGGKASSDLPLNVSERSIQGRVGTGQYEIRLETTNGSLVVNRID
ncbi:DUF4097 family beta strand repeat-containing protein [Paenibacillus flagellatus]|uniref:Uncharacterized protein n=1 Tax=Paenibacillus flagellatus TaxID=2211139 RepID=A0A2V5JXP2_9BACL|nr:DUF4097 family beta strand repeat-containing protein [Paenibacillus flagellatus]PYI51639.1 hypothetical protein DLM86_24855 [Paenibacillus flagellatus]